jgi:histidine ammonia-lyase
MIRIDGNGLTVEQVEALAHRRDTAHLAPEAIARVQAAREFADSWDGPVYGRSTAVGANREVSLVDPAGQSLALLRSHATSAGPLRSPERVRAMLAVRLNQLAAGGSGASPAVLDGLAALLSADALPPVREWGGIGTGDLPALAATGLALRGEPAPDPAVAPIPVGIGDVLPLLSSNAGAIGDAALAVAALRELARAGVVVAALGLVAVRGNPEAYAPAAESVTPFAGAQAVCRTVRDLVAGIGAPARIQDPFALRALPQVQGALLDRLDELASVVEVMSNRASENPVIVPGRGVAHHGGFHAAYLTQALDAMRSSLAQAAELALSRVSMFCEPGLTGCAPFLGDGTPGASGIMVVEYVAASVLGELRALAAPAGVQTVTLSRGLEEDASFADLGARQALAAVPAYRVLLACELVSAVRCLRMSGAAVPAGLTSSLERCAALPDPAADRDLSADIAIAQELLAGLG